MELKKYHPTIKFVEGVLNVYVPRLLKNEREYDLLIETGLKFYNKLKEY